MLKPPERPFLSWGIHASDNTPHNPAPVQLFCQSIATQGQNSVLENELRCVATGYTYCSLRYSGLTRYLG